jgi:hypothetical protein
MTLRRSTRSCKEISKEWLKIKGGRELGFVLGSLGLEQPSAKRYFVARSGNNTGRIEGFVVCEPIYGPQWLLP